MKIEKENNQEESENKNLSLYLPIGMSCSIALGSILDNKDKK